MKRIIVMLAAVLAVVGIRAETEKVGAYTWTYRVNGTGAEICNSYNYAAISPSPTGVVAIPSTLGVMRSTIVGE